jgi:integrase
LRISEIANLTWSNIQDDQLRWIGKGNRQRSANPGPTLTALLARWQRQYERSIGRPVKPSDPILCKQPKGCPVDADRPELLWGQAANAEILRRHLIRRAQQADLGHVAPHDLRRSAASILHHATTNDGGHRFDLLDIQQVLGHADPATTMRSYIDHIDADTLKRAGEILD